MPVNPTVETVIFDLGGVLMMNGSARDLHALFAPEHVETAIEILMGPGRNDPDHPWHLLERGEISLEECRSRQQAGLESAGISMLAPPPEQQRAAFAFRTSEPMIELVGELREAGIRTGILTNNVREFRPWWDALHPWDELMDDIVDSHEVGLRKPDSAIYELALQRLGATASRTAFLDDAQANVEGAAALGIHGVFVEPDQTAAIAHVRRLAGLA